MSSQPATEIFHIENDPDLAAGLAALGFVIQPTKTGDQGAESAQANITIGFRCVGLAPDKELDIYQLSEARRTGTFPANHPLQAALLGIQTRRVLAQWQRGAITTPHVCVLTGNKLARALQATERSRGADISSRLRDGPSVTLELDHAAAAIVAGHGIRQMLPGGLAVSDRNPWHEGLTASILAAAAAVIAQDGARAATMPLPGAKPGEHPFLYALMGIQQARALSTAAEKMPVTWKLNSPFSRKFALVDERLMDGPGSFKDHVYRHLKS